MAKISILGCGLSIILALLSVSCDSSVPPALPPFPADPPKPLAQPKSEQELRVILRKTCDEVNQLAKSKGYLPLVASPDSCRYQLRTTYPLETDNKYFNEVSAQFDSARICDATMIASSGKFTRFLNNAVWNTLEKAPEYETPPQPTWTEAHAIEVASEFADIFTKSYENKSLGKPVARFGYSGNHASDEKTGKLLTAEGMWIVVWGEQSPSGFPFEYGGVSVSISEKYGPYQIRVNLGTYQYEEDLFKPIAQDDALKIAAKCLKTLLAEESANGILPDAQAADNPKMQLVIAAPNEGIFRQPTSLPNSGFLDQSKGRLAWKVTYHVSTSARYLYGDLIIYIDAKDGRFLCSTYPLVLAS